MDLYKDNGNLFEKDFGSTAEKMRNLSYNKGSTMEDMMLYSLRIIVLKD